MAIMYQYQPLRYGRYVLFLNNHGTDGSINFNVCLTILTILIILAYDCQMVFKVEAVLEIRMSL